MTNEIAQLIIDTKQRINTLAAHLEAVMASLPAIETNENEEPKMENKMDMTRVNSLIEHAVEMIDAGFSSKAQQKRANEKLNSAYDQIQSWVHAAACNIALEIDPKREDQEAWAAKVREYDIPFNLHQVRDRHIEKTAEISKEVAEKISLLLEMREAVKAQKVEKVEKKQKSEYQVRAEKTLTELLKKRQEQYLEAVELGRIFEGLPVSANTHYVVNEHNTEFLRTFYYLNGKLTPLNVIIAAAEELAREKAE